MNRNKKTVAAIAATLLAVSPVAASVIDVPATHTTVKAATQLSSDELMQPYYTKASSSDFVIKLTKATPYLTVYDGDTVHQISKRRITDVSSNYGRVTKRDGDVQIFRTMDSGDPDFNSELKQEDKVHQGENYVALINFDIDGTNLDDIERTSTSYVSYYDFGHEMLVEGFFDDGDSVSLLVPVEVKSAPAKTDNEPVSVPSVTTATKSKSAYVNVRKNSKVKTYTSTGRFSKHYVYGHHTYKVTSKKYISGHGYCWKLSGKNQYVPAKYVKVR